MARNYWSADIDVIYDGVHYLFTQLTQTAQQRILAKIGGGRVTGRIKKTDLKAVETYKEENPT